MAHFNGLGMNMGNLALLSRAETRSISPENFTGEKGKGGMSTDGPAASSARELGQGWKISPFVIIQPGQTFTLAEAARGFRGRAVGGHAAFAFLAGEVFRTDRPRFGFGR